MAIWIIDTGNTKRGFYFSKVQDITSHAYLKEDNNDYIPVFGNEKVYAFHTQSDPRSMVIFEKENENGSFTTSIGLKNFDNSSTSQPLRLEEIKEFLDSADSNLSPVVMLQYQFDSPDADVANSEAIENARYVTKITDTQGNSRIVDIITDETVWSSPEQKHVINYFFAGKIKSIPDTYFILLNSFRTELYQELRTFENHVFEYLDHATGSFGDFFIRPSVSNGKIFGDTIFAESSNIKLKIFGETNEFLSNNNFTANDINYEYESNLICSKNSEGNLDIDLGDKTVGFVSINIPSNNMLDVAPDIAIRRTFTVHRN